MTDIKNRNVVYLNKEKSIAVIEDKNNDYLVTSRISVNENILTYDIVEYFAKSFNKAMEVVNKINDGWIFDYF